MYSFIGKGSLPKQTRRICDISHFSSAPSEEMTEKAIDKVEAAVETVEEKVEGFFDDDDEDSYEA